MCCVLFVLFLCLCVYGLFLLCFSRVCFVLIGICFSYSDFLCFMLLCLFCVASLMLVLFVVLLCVCVFVLC